MKRSNIFGGNVAREISMFCTLMLLAVASMKSSWDHSMICTNPCLSGHEVMESNRSSAISAEVGGQDNGVSRGKGAKR